MSFAIPKPPSTNRQAPADGPQRSAATTADAAPVLARFVRPLSAPTHPKFNARRHQSFLQQLRSTLVEAQLETPPTDVAASEVQKRIALLQRMIADTERMGEEERMRIEHARNERYVSAERERIRQEERIARSTQESAERHRRNYENLKEDTAMLHRHRHRILSHRTERCHAAITEAAVAMQEKLSDAEAKREVHLDQLAQRRNESVLWHKEQLRAREEHCEAVLQKKHELDQQSYELKVQQAEALRKKAEARLRQAERSRSQSASARNMQVAERAMRGRSSRVSIVLHHGITQMEVQSKPFETRLAEAAAQEKRRQQRYEEEHRVRLEYANFRSARSEDRYRAQQERVGAIASARLEQGAAIQREVQRKASAGSVARQRRREACEAAGERKARDVLVHQCRSDQQEYERIESIRRARFEKWSGRTDAVAETLLTEYVTLAKDALLREGLAQQQQQQQHLLSTTGTSSAEREREAHHVVEHNQLEREGSLRLHRGTPAASPRTCAGSVPLATKASFAIRGERSPEMIGQVSPPRAPANPHPAVSATLSANRRHETIQSALSGADG